jgi:hypothetical protein
MSPTGTLTSYIDGLIQGIKDVYSWINSTIFLRRIKDIKTFNPTHALGFNNYDVNIVTILELWGEDPVHPTPSGYRVLAERLASMVDDVLTDVTVNNDPPPQQKKRQAVREPWIVASEPVAKWLDGTQAKQKQWQQRSQAAGRGRGGPPRGGRHISRGSYSPHTGQPGRGNHRGRGGGNRGRGRGPPPGPMRPMVRQSASHAGQQWKMKSDILIFWILICVLSRPILLSFFLLLLCHLLRKCFIGL